MSREPEETSSPEPRAAVRRVPALGVRNYRIFFTAQSISLVGTWMQTLGQAWLIVVLTRDPLILGLASAAQGLPILLFNLFAGALAWKSLAGGSSAAAPFGGGLVLVGWLLYAVAALRD